MLQRRHQPLLSLTWVLGRPHAQEEENPLPLRWFLVDVGLNEPKQHGCIRDERSWHETLLTFRYEFVHYFAHPLG